MTAHLVTTSWLIDHLQDPTIRILDIRGNAFLPEDSADHTLARYEDYTQSHIPNASFVNWVEDITDDPQHKRVAPMLKYANAMGKLGISNEHFVVVYDDASSILAARMWWTLRYYGHTRVAVLDGGWQKWLDENRPVTTEIPQIDQAEFKAQPQHHMLKQGHEILQSLESTSRIIDMRLPEEYRGEMTLARYAGHIPGASNLPVNRLISDDNSLLPTHELRKVLSEVGVDSSASEVIFYGNVGLASCLGILATEVVGLDIPISNYDASWQEWGNDERKPKVTENHPIS